MFLGCIIVVKNRRQRKILLTVFKLSKCMNIFVLAASYIQYIGTVCMFAKILSTYLFFVHNPMMGAGYVLLCLCESLSCCFTWKHYGQFVISRQCTLHFCQSRHIKDLITSPTSVVPIWRQVELPFFTDCSELHFQDEIDQDKRVTWLIEFYAAWSPACVTFAPMMAELSAK